MTIQQAGARLRARSISCAELTEESLARVEAHRDLNAFITVTADHARRTAAALDDEFARGLDRGPLHGIPVAIKDLFAMRGVPNTCGSPLFRESVPNFDATVVKALEGAGAVIVGKTNLHELAYGVTSNNPHFGAVRNPYNRECIPGGSSGGSGAAVAADCVFMAMGTDTGGSIRIPAAYCGTVGIKPTYGLVSRYGCSLLGLTLDHMGPLTRTVEDAALTLNAIAGHDPLDPNTRPGEVEDFTEQLEAGVHGLRFGVPENFYLEDLDPDVGRAFERMLRLAGRAGAQLAPVRVPDIAQLNAVSRLILLGEAASVMQEHLHDRSKFGKDVLALLDQGRLVPATDYIAAQRLRRVFMNQFTELFKSIDCLLTPTAPIGAPRIGQERVEVSGHQEDVRLASTRFVRGIVPMGLPAISIPCGRTGEGLPVGLQIVGRVWEDSLVLRVAAALEKAQTE